ncbi:cilia- and flagella-associated protein 91-like [Uranotaenia lowii]|uniref:cilia- and flagella-associated protein 91-like n=1 Tax=Uranotaenia lowii TaxID=190385 RepID=UPI00247926F8|nr:cilia- and flagella-associated protein 91-like [Uranotaenia lowii]
MTYRSHVVAPSRAFDHIYDPLYVASDLKDVCKANVDALSRSAPIGIFPVYQSMFSELPRLTRNHYVMHRNPLPYYPEALGGGPPVDMTERSRILGTERPKFFCHPNTGEPGQLIRINQSYEDYCHCDETSEPRFRDVASQTMYRESSAQTKPWMPNAVLKDGDWSKAEVVHVTGLIEHSHYPGINEVEIVERARKKRNWEHAMGGCESPEDWLQHRLTLQIFEWEEWVARERQIDRYQMIRLQLVSKIMDKRERDLRQATESKMQNTKNRINEQRNRAIEKLRVSYERNVRKLDKKRQDAKANKFRSALARRLEEAPLGPGGKKVGSKKSYSYDPNLIEVGLSKLDRKITICHTIKDVQKQRPELWKPKEVCRELQKGFWSDHFLRKLYDSLKHFRHKKETKPTMPKCLIVVSSPTESLVDSPQRISEDREDDALYQHAVLLQKLIKGRAMQEMIHSDYAEDRDIVEDLIATHRLPVVEEFFPIAPTKSGSVREKYLNILRNETHLDNFIETCTTSEMSLLMATLERELTRLQNERNTQAFYLLAEQERYFREASYSGGSAARDSHRRSSDGKIKDSDELSFYLVNSLLERIDRESLDENREKIHELAKKFDTEADKQGSLLEEQHHHTGTIASCFMDEMMLPDVFCRVARENIKLKQKPLLAQAHEAIFQKIEDQLPDNLEEQLIEKMKEELAISNEPEQPEKPDAIAEPDLGTRSESQVIIGNILSNMVESVMSENEVEEIPEDHTTEAEDSVEEAGQMASDLIEDILCNVFQNTDDL